MKRIGLTGSSGFIGEALADSDWAKHPEYKIYHIGRTNKSYDNFIEFDLSQITQKNTLPPLDCVIHLAAYIPTEQSDKDDHDYFTCERVNGRGTLKLIESLPKDNLNKFIYVSSAHIWKDRKNRILKNFYEGSKRSGELSNEVFGLRYDYNFFNLRLSYVYGPGSEHGNMFDIFLARARKNEKIELHNQGQDQINLIHVDDVVTAINSAMKKENLPPGNYPICEETPTKTETIAKTVKELTGSSSELDYVGSKDDAAEQYFNYEKTNETLGFSPQTSLKEGINSLIQEAS